MFEKLLKHAVASPYGIVVSVDDVRAARYLRRRLYSDRCQARKSGATELDEISTAMRSLARPPTSASHQAAAANPPLTLTSQRRTAGENPRPRPRQCYITFQFLVFRSGRWRTIRSVIMNGPRITTSTDDALRPSAFDPHPHVSLCRLLAYSKALIRRFASVRAERSRFLTIAL